METWVASCDKCQKHKPNKPNHGQLIPLRTTYPFEIVGIDIQGPFKTSRAGNKYILVCIDYFTNWVEACPIKSEDAVTVADAILSLIITRHGCPEKVLTDKGTQFTSKLIQHLLKKFNIIKLETTAYHPQTNGKVERFNRFIATALSFLVNSQHDDWDKYIDLCLLAYRVTVNRIVNETLLFTLWT